MNIEIAIIAIPLLIGALACVLALRYLIGLLIRGWIHSKVDQFVDQAIRRYERRRRELW